VADRVDRFVTPHLRKNEDYVASISGVIAGYSRWTSIAGAVAVGLALIVPPALGLNFFFGLAILFAVLIAGFMALTALVGKPMAQRHEPPLTSPNITLAITTRRLLLIERGTGKVLSTLVEEAPTASVSAVEFTKGTLFTPHRLAYRVPAGTRSFEFPRLERAAEFSVRLTR
jgi:hypothetical protein